MKALSHSVHNFVRMDTTHLETMKQSEVFGNEVWGIKGEIKKDDGEIEVRRPQ